MKESSFVVEVSASIPAPAAKVYALMRDYNPEGHPSVLPKQYFTDLRIVKGGVGAGTIIDVDMKNGGTKTTMRLEVTEPAPNKLLVEEDKAMGVLTHFIFEDAADGTSRLTFKTWFRRKPGFRGWVEKLIVPGITRKVYREELGLVAKRFGG